MSYLKTKRSVKTATLVEGSIYESDTITSPFVAGFIRPKIYLPASLGDNERSYILLHEKTHIKRRDYLVKPVWFIAVCLHWFNPLVWVAYSMLGRDIEMSCDEAVIRKLGDGVRADYSTSLLALSAPRLLSTGSPLAFGESNTFSRIKNVLNFKKPVFWVIIVAVLAAAATVFILAANPAEDAVETTVADMENSTADKYLQYKTDYIGDNSAVGGIISLMAFPEDMSVDHFELQTETAPYGVTIYLNTDRTLPAALGIEEELSVYVHNSAIFFALVGNADMVYFELVADNGRQATFSYTREEINEMYGFDVRTYTESSRMFQALLTANTVFKEDLDGKTAAAVEENLAVIQSSPAYSSNPGDYIDAHQEEYKAILKLGQPALEYMLSCFADGEGDTLKGHIMKLLCQELLGPDYNFPGEYLQPSEWYEKYLNTVEAASYTTAVPSVEPTAVPSEEPTAVPSVEPTAVPSERADRRTVSRADRRTVSRADRRTVGGADCCPVSRADRRTVGGANRRTIRGTDCHAVRRADCRLVSGADRRPGRRAPCTLRRLQ